MAEKRIYGRAVQKHDVESNWLKKTTFVPMQGEMIVYDKDSNYSYERIKIGDGSTLVSALPFVDDATKSSIEALESSIDDVNSRIDGVNVLIGDTSVSEQIDEAIANKSDSDHLHDDRYYTESEIDSKLSTKSNTGHTHSTYVNQNAFSNVVVGSTTIAADSTTDSLTLVAGDNITITPDATNDKITIAATDTVYTHPTSGVSAGTYKSVTVNAQGHVTGGSNPTTLSGYGITDAATKTEFNTLNDLVGDTSVSEQIDDAFNSAITGLSASGQTVTYTKGDGSTGTIKTQDTIYAHPSYTAKSSGLYKVTVDDKGHISSTAAVTKDDIVALGIPAEDTDTTYSAATINTAGLMSAADKIKLNGIATGANKITVDSALSSTSTNPVQNNVVNAALYNLSTLVGDTAVSEQISSAIDAIDLGVTNVTMTGPAATVTYDNGTTSTYKLNGIASASTTDGRLQCTFSTETDYQNGQIVLKYYNGSGFSSCWSLGNNDDAGTLKYQWYNESGWAGQSYLLTSKNYGSYITASGVPTGGSEGQILAVNADGTISPNARTIASLGTGATYSLDGTTLTITTL